MSDLKKYSLFGIHYSTFGIHYSTIDHEEASLSKLTTIKKIRRMKGSILNYLKKQSFQPDLLSVFINPFFFISKGLHRHIGKNSHYLKGVLLDFGCGCKPYRNLFTVDKYVGVDIEVSGHSHHSAFCLA